MEYTILTSETFFGVTEQVNKYIQGGWLPLGGLCFVEGFTAQAMTLKEKKKTGVKKFIKPTGEELNQFARDEKITFNGFYDYYQSNGWKVGKNGMKDWKAAARKWSKTSFGGDAKVANKGAATVAFNFDEIDKAAQNKSDPAKVRKMLADNKKREMYKATGQLPEHKENKE